MSLGNSPPKYSEENAITLRIMSADEENQRTVETIVTAARLHGVKLREDVPLVQSLAHFNVTESIPPELYRTVSEILTFLQHIETSIK